MEAFIIDIAYREVQTLARQGRLVSPAEAMALGSNIETLWSISTRIGNQYNADPEVIYNLLSNKFQRFSPIKHKVTWNDFIL